jgi:hypothetical protein
LDGIWSVNWHRTQSRYEAPYDGNSHFSLNINDYLDTSAPAPLARHLPTARVTVLTEKY